MKHSLISQKEIFSHPLIKKYRETYNENFIALRTGDYFIILYENSEIFAALSYVTDEGPFIWLSEIKVRKDSRKNGYGSEIIKHLFTIAKKQKKNIRLNCTNDVRDFFTKLKFKPINDREFEITCEELDSLK